MLSGPGFRKFDGVTVNDATSFVFRLLLMVVVEGIVVVDDALLISILSPSAPLEFTVNSSAVAWLI